MTAIAATRRTVKELVDGTLRVTVDVEPMNKAAFLLAFPEVDAPIALAPLNYGGSGDIAGAGKPIKDDIEQMLKDFYSDRCRYDEHASPFETTREIYDTWARRICEMFVGERPDDDNDAPIALAPLNYGGNDDDEKRQMWREGWQEIKPEARPREERARANSLLVNPCGCEKGKPHQCEKPKELGELIEDPETREALDKAFKPKGGPHSHDDNQLVEQVVQHWTDEQIKHDVRHELVKPSSAGAPELGNPASGAAPERPKGGPHSQDAARICKSVEFQAFVHDKSGCEQNEKGAAESLRAYCLIFSRAELDSNPEALQRFHRLMREFNEWRERAAHDKD